MPFPQRVSHLRDCRQRLADLRCRPDYLALTGAILRREGCGGTDLFDQPFARIFPNRPFFPRSIVCQAEQYAVGFYPAAADIPPDRIPALLIPIEAITGEIVPLIRNLPAQVCERFQLPKSDDWWRIVFHLGWHFPGPFLKPVRCRILVKEGSPPSITEETFVQMNGLGGRFDLFPGLIYSDLQHDLCTCSEIAVGVILDALERLSRTGPSGPPEAQHLSADARRTFDRLRADFLAGASMPGGSLECKLLKLADDFEAPPASEWAGVTIGGIDEKFPVLSRRNGQQEIVQIRGPATDWFWELAEQAGESLPLEFPDCPILFGDIRPNEAGLPVGIRGPRPVMNRGPRERWIGFVFDTLKRHQLLQVRWGTSRGPLAYGFATLDRDLFAASVQAIDLEGLTNESDPSAAQQTGPREVRTVDLPPTLAGLRDIAAREYAASKGTFWLAGFPAGLEIARCDQHDPVCGIVADGRVALPWGGLRALGSVGLGDQGTYQLLAFSVAPSRMDELECFLSFSSSAGAALVASPPPWARGLSRPGDPSTTWVTALMFLAPGAAACVVEKAGGCRLIVQPWAASLAALREWDGGSKSDQPRLGAGEEGPDMFNGWEFLREAPADQVSQYPPPAAGRFVIALDPPAHDPRAELRGEERILSRNECLAIQWEDSQGKQVLHPTDGFLLGHCQRDATWLPDGWEMDVFPAGWTLPHLESWFGYALEMAKIEGRSDIQPGSDHSPACVPTPRGLVAHAHLIVRHLGLPHAPAEPRGAMDRAGCIADLRDLLSFFRQALRPTVQGTCTAAHGHEDPPAESRLEDQPSVMLRRRDQGPIVRGKEKPVLTDREFNVIAALIAAGQRGLNKDKLDEKSGHSEARKVLRELRNSDPDWASVIHMPGKPGRGGYRIL